MALSLAREFHFLLAQLYISAVHDLRDYVGSFPEVVSDEIGLAVLHLIHAELFRRIGLDVGELVVVIDRLDIEGGFIRLVDIVELELRWIGALVLVNGLFNMRLKRGKLLPRLFELASAGQ